MSAIRRIVTASVAVLTLASAAQAQSVTTLRIGLDGSENSSDQVKRTSCVIDGLKAATGVSEVQVFPSPDYNGVIQGLLGATIDIAILGASAYASIYLQDPEAVDPILTSKQSDGSLGYYTIMVARADSGIKTIADAKGKKLGFADPDSASGYLVPNVALPAELGVPVNEYFGETGFGGGHENLVLGVVDGTWDVGTTFGSGIGEWSEGYTSGNLRIMVDKGIVDMDDLVEVWRSPVIPNGPLLVSNKLPAEVKEGITTYFAGLAASDFECFDAFTGGGYVDFAPVDQTFYQTIIDARKSVIGG